MNNIAKEICMQGLIFFFQRVPHVGMKGFLHFHIKTTSQDLFLQEAWTGEHETQVPHDW